MNTLNPIEELYNLYSDKETFPHIVEVLDNGVITPGFIEELDKEGRLIEDKYLDLGVMDQEH